MSLRTRIRTLFDGHTPRLQTLELLKYIGPGFLVTVGFIDPGNWASERCCRFALRLPSSVDGHPLDPDADRPAAQCRPPRHRHRSVHLRSGHEVHSSAGSPDSFWALLLSPASPRPLPRSSARPSASDLLFGLPLRIGAVMVTAGRHLAPAQQRLPADREGHHRLRLTDRPVISL